MKIELRKKFWFYYWVLVGANGEVLATSETYSSKQKAKQTAHRLGKEFGLVVQNTHQ